MPILRLRSLIIWLTAGLLVSSVVAATAYFLGATRDSARVDRHPAPIETVSKEVTDYQPPQADPEEILQDDFLSAKTSTFDPDLIDRRPLGAWRVNLSEAVTKLDVPMVLPDAQSGLLDLHPSYTAAMKLAREKFSWLEVLPSVNLIDGKAKQFDDGLVAALDQANFRGLDGSFPGLVSLVRRIFEKVGPRSIAAPFLAAGLELAGEKAEVNSVGEKDRWLRDFHKVEERSKPIGVHAWTPKLSDCFRFVRFFQHEFDPRDLAVPRAIAQALAEDEAIRGEYVKAIAFFAQRANPPACETMADLIEDKAGVAKLHVVAFFPPSTSREGELFAKLFPKGVPPGVNLMREFVRRIRSGEVNLTPRPKGGWYDYQVFALEALLLPEMSEGHDNLFLTRTYKKRMLEAFQALMTKRRETHVLMEGVTAGVPPGFPSTPSAVKPRLRIEPCPSYYLRTARAYEFLRKFLVADVGGPALASLQGLREGGERARSLGDELTEMRDLFYGLYLIDAEDIGLRPTFFDEEVVDRPRCEEIASGWLSRLADDPDLAADTRVAVPISRSPNHLWATIGVRLTRLDASYARAPRIKPTEGAGDWRPASPETLSESNYLIAVDEFAEAERSDDRVFDRRELRALCDRAKTKEAIVRALRD